MMRPVTAPRPWTVLHPGPLTPRGEGLWTIDDDVPGLPGATRRMTIVRRRDGSLLFYNAVPVPEEVLRQIRALGRPAQLVLPNALHALDAAAFALKLNVTAYAPEVAVAALAARLPCQPISALPPEEGLRVFTVDGFRTREAVLLVGDTLLVGDLVTNAPHGRGVVGLLMRLVGFTGPEPRLPKPVRKRVEVDTAAVQALFRTLADQPGLARIIPSHGEVMDRDAAALLRHLAASL